MIKNGKWGVESEESLILFKEYLFSANKRAISNC
jgi:hypothetical protein